MTMTSQRCYSRVLFLLVFIAFRCNEGTVFFASAQGHFNQQPKPQTPGNHRSSQPASSPPPYPPLPSQESQERVSATPENYSYCGAKGSFGSAKLLLPSFKNKLHLLASRKRPDWSASAQATTRLSGGADSPNENSQFSDKSSSQADPVVQDGNKKQKAFLGGFRPQKSMLPKVLKGKTGADLAKKVKEGVAMVQETSAQVVPSFLTVLSLIWTADKGISFFTLYGISLLGASCGFYMFLYFITVGYALGVTLPLLVALYAYNHHKTLSRATFFHSAITVAWGVRILVFFLWREYISWPALHQKVVELQSKMDIPFASKILCWCVYSFFYVAMIASNWSRLQQSTPKWGLLGYSGLLLQVGGLSLETIADMQKNGFKSRHRHSWCDAGVWKWSTHPNYLGEGLFWWGTYLAHGFSSILLSLLATVGLMFIMVILQGSTRSLSHKQLEKYGDQPDFCEFQRSHSIWGPKRWWWWLHGMGELSWRSSTQPANNFLGNENEMLQSVGADITSTSTTEDAPPIQL